MGWKRMKRDYGKVPKRPATVRPATGHRFLIVVEGEATEVEYLNGVRVKLEREAAAVVVHHGRHTDPVGMVKEAMRLRDEQAKLAGRSMMRAVYDQTWVVFDQEGHSHPRRKQLPKAIDLAKANGVEVALSIPSFEFWLLLHYEFTTSPFDGCGPVLRALKKHIKDYGKSNLPLVELLERVETAVKHSARCHKHWDDVSGDRNPSTRVCQLITALNDSARDGVRFLL